MTASTVYQLLPQQSPTTPFQVNRLLTCAKVFWNPRWPDVGSMWHACTHKPACVLSVGLVWVWDYCHPHFFSGWCVRSRAYILPVLITLILLLVTVLHDTSTSDTLRKLMREETSLQEGCIRDVDGKKVTLAILVVLYSSTLNNNRMLNNCRLS